MRAKLARVAALILTLFALSTPGMAHEGHDHGEAPKTLTPVAPRGEAHAGDFEIVAVLRDREVVIFLDRFDTNEPIVKAEIEALTPKGSAKAVPKDDGTYRLAAEWADGRDHYDLIFTVTVGETSEVLPVTIVGAKDNHETATKGGFPVWVTVLVAFIAGLFAFAGGVLATRRYPQLLKMKVGAVAALILAAFVTPANTHESGNHNGGANAAVQGGRDTSQRLPDGGVFVPKSVQRLLVIRTAIIKEGEHARTIELPGRVIPDPNASGYVQSSLAGRLMPPEGGFPALGSRVEKGQVLALVEPPLQTIDVSDMRQKDGELQQQIAIVERRVARFEKLVSSNAVPRAQLEDARTELESLRERKVQLDKTRREPEVLRAPVSGVIAEANTIAGQLAQPNTVIFHIADPARLWVEALSFEAIPQVERASARGHDGLAMDLQFRGSAAALRNQSITVHLAIERASGSVWPGQFVTVFLSLPEKRRGILLPRAAVVRSSNGQYVVFEHAGAERFMPHEVKAEVFDAENMLVTAGLADGKRVVVQGAELLEQVR